MSKSISDPGHGGIDPGTIGPGGTREADVVLPVVLQAASYLKASGIEALLTRSSASVPWKQVSGQPYYDLHGRTEIANNAKADIFLSVHCNAATPSAHGTETCCYKFGGNGEKLARCVQAEVVKTLGTTDRGVKEGNFQVLRDTVMPAALVELAFISNPAEEKLLADPVVQTKLAKAIAKGICNYFNVQFVEQQSTPATGVSDYAEVAWAKAVAKGIFDGTDPQGAWTREQGAVVLDKLKLL